MDIVGKQRNEKYWHFSILIMFLVFADKDIS